AERIIGEGRKMQHGVQSDEIGHFDVTRILADGGHRKDFTAMCECAAFVEIAVKTNHVVSRLNEHRRENSADEAKMPRYQHTHLMRLLSSSSVQLMNSYQSFVKNSTPSDGRSNITP